MDAGVGNVWAGVLPIVAAGTEDPAATTMTDWARDEPDADQSLPLADLPRSRRR